MKICIKQKVFVALFGPYFDIRVTLTKKFVWVMVVEAVVGCKHILVFSFGLNHSDWCIACSEYCPPLQSNINYPAFYESLNNFLTGTEHGGK